MNYTANATAVKRRKPFVLPRSVLTVVGCVLIGFMLFPIYWMVNVSLQPAGSAASVAPLFPIHPDFAGYGIAIAQQGRNLLTSLIVATGSATLALLIAAPAAYGLSHLRLPFVNLSIFVVIVAQMIPGIVIANSVYVAYSNAGLLNSYLGLILADASQGIPFCILVIRSFMIGIPKEILEAAKVDGAGQVRTFISIVIPISRNALITAGLFGFLFAWSDFLFAATLTTDESVRPITLGIYQYISGYVSSWSPVMATAVLASIPAVVLLVIGQRYITLGVTGGAVK